MSTYTPNYPQIPLDPTQRLLRDILAELIGLRVDIARLLPADDDTTEDSE